VWEYVTSNEANSQNSNTSDSTTTQQDAKQQHNTERNEELGGFHQKMMNIELTSSLERVSVITSINALILLHLFINPLIVIHRRTNTQTL